MRGGEKGRVKGRRGEGEIQGRIEIGKRENKPV
jgi:hypothetical protein